jgi:hypothetical protein
MSLTGYGELLDVFHPFGPRLILRMPRERNAMPDPQSDMLCPTVCRSKATTRGRLLRFVPSFEMRHDIVECWRVVGVEEGGFFAGERR